jgi:hypothetical protein
VLPAHCRDALLERRAHPSRRAGLLEGHQLDSVAPI